MKKKDQEPSIVEAPQIGHDLPVFAVGDACEFVHYDGVVENVTIVECPEDGKVTVKYESGGTLKVNRCYLRKA